METISISLTNTTKGESNMNKYVYSGGLDTADFYAQKGTGLMELQHINIDLEKSRILEFFEVGVVGDMGNSCLTLIRVKREIEKLIDAVVALFRFDYCFNLKYHIKDKVNFFSMIIQIIKTMDGKDGQQSITFVEDSKRQSYGNLKHATKKTAFTFYNQSADNDRKSHRDTDTRFEVRLLAMYFYELYEVLRRDKENRDQAIASKLKRIKLSSEKIVIKCLQHVASELKAIPKGFSDVEQINLDVLTNNWNDYAYNDKGLDLGHMYEFLTTQRDKGILRTSTQVYIFLKNAGVKAPRDYMKNRIDKWNDSKYKFEFVTKKEIQLFVDEMLVLVNSDINKVKLAMLSDSIIVE